MSEMVERVARAMWEVGPDETKRVYDIGPDKFRQVGWAEFPDMWKEIYRRRARAAIAAMREPTPDILRAVKGAMPVEIDYWQRDRVLHAEFRKPEECVQPESIVHAMIDAALASTSSATNAEDSGRQG